jgi:Anti-sigma-K factor rskA
MSNIWMDSGMAKDGAAGKMMEGRIGGELNQPAVRQAWYLRLALWRAIAGMAFAIALACVIVALEHASQLSSSSTHYHHRLRVLSARVAQIQTELADARRQLSVMRAEQDSRETMNRILQSRDAAVVPLGADVANHNTSGLIAISKNAGKAMLEVAGLPASPGNWYVMWWLPAGKPPVRAAQFRTDSDGRAAVRVQMPPVHQPILGSMITDERDGSPGQPSGQIVLKGALAGRRNGH